MIRIEDMTHGQLTMELSSIFLKHSVDVWAGLNIARKTNPETLRAALIVYRDAMEAGDPATAEDALIQIATVAVKTSATSVRSPRRPLPSRPPQRPQGPGDR